MLEVMRRTGFGLPTTLCRGRHHREPTELRPRPLRRGSGRPVAYDVHHAVVGHSRFPASASEHQREEHEPEDFQLPQLRRRRSDDMAGVGRACRIKIQNFLLTFAQSGRRHQ